MVIVILGGSSGCPKTNGDGYGSSNSEGSGGGTVICGCDDIVIVVTIGSRLQWLSYYYYFSTATVVSVEEAVVKWIPFLNKGFGQERRE